jgi:AAA15 family ATPase/GTPase
MILEISIQNFRSIQEEQTFSMIADAGKSKIENTFEANPVGSTDPLKLLRSAVIYGANASGKSNVIRAIYALRMVATQTGKLAMDESIDWYEPFRFDENSARQPTGFKIQFIGPDNIRYHYEIQFNEDEIVFEKLDFYPSGYPANLFERKANGESMHIIKKGKALKGRMIPPVVFKNQAFLSKFGTEIPHDQLSPIYLYFSNIVVLNVLDNFKLGEIRMKVAKEIAKPESDSLKRKLSKLIRISDTRIEGIESLETTEEDFVLPDKLPEALRKKLMEQYSRKTMAIHKIYKDGLEIGTEMIDLDEESAGTIVLFAIGGMILQTLEKGGIIIVDELDNSLHPKLCKFLVRLFHHNISNKANAQLIFATHEVTLLDRDVFRKDQIWFVEKDKFGQTEIFQASDVDGARDDTNFENWYRTGKFGGQPHIKEIEFILGDA